MSLPDSATLIPAASRLLTIDVRGRRSERRLSVLALLAVAAAAGLLSARPATAALFFVAAAAVVAIGLARQGWLGGARGLTRVSWLSDGSWLLTEAGRTSLPATLSPDSRAGTRWVWLRWRVDTRTGDPGGNRGPCRRSLLILQGDLAPSDLRRLIVRLRLESVSHRRLNARFLGA